MKNTETPEIMTDNITGKFNWKGKNILIVDDVPDHANMIIEYFGDTNANFYVVGTGAKAIEFCMDELVKIDLILMDIKLPGVSGYDVARIIKNVYNDIPIIAQTAYAAKEDREKCKKAGFDGYISKPICFDLAAVIINKYLS